MINIDTLFGGRIPTIFGGDTGMTYEELQRRKKVAEALMGGGPQRITNVGEGIYSASRDIAGALLGKKLRKEESRQQDEANSAFDSTFGGGGLGGAPAGGYGTPPAAGEAPASWDQIKNGIFAGESGGDYNALFGYSNRPGGQFQGVKLTDMTVDQALQFSDPSGPYAGWVKGQVGRVATPMGAYQVVGSTLRAAKQGLGLRGDERMTPELQDQIGQWIYKTQGTGAWAGYKGPRSGGGGGQQQQVSPAMLAQFAAQANNPALSPDRRAQAQAMYDAAAAQYAQQLKPQEAPKRDTQYVDGVGLIDTQTGEVVQQYDTPQKPEKPPTSVQEYEYYRKQEADAGREPMPYSDWVTAEEKAGNPALQQAQQDRVDTASDVIGITALRALEAAKTRDVGGIAGNIAALNPGSQNAELYRQVGALRNIGSAAALDAMRKASPTGGALGNVTERELGLLADQAGSLDPRSPNFERDLQTYVLTLYRTVHGYEAGNRIFQQTIGQLPQEAQQVQGGQPQPEAAPEQAPAPAGIPRTFEEFSANPDAQRAAEQYGVTVQEMWEILQEQQP